MRFLADMGVSVRVVKWLRDRDHDAIHLQDQGMHRLPDEEIFSKAISEKRIILTFDLDFGEIVALSKGNRTGVILFRLRNTRTDHVIERLEAILKDTGDVLEGGAVVIVEEFRHRIREFPVKIH